MMIALLIQPWMMQLVGTMSFHVPVGLAERTSKLVEMQHSKTKNKATVGAVVDQLLLTRFLMATISPYLLMMWMNQHHCRVLTVSGQIVNQLTEQTNIYSFQKSG